MDSLTERRQHRQGFAALVRDFARWLFYIVLASLFLAAIVLYFVHTRLDEEIRRHIESLFQSQYPGLQVAVRSARRVPGTGVEIRSLTISDPHQADKRFPLLFVDELWVRCDTDLSDMVQGQICTQQVIARRVQVHARQQDDGSWNVASLLPFPKFGDRPPPVVLEDAAIAIEPSAQSGRPPITFHNVNLTIRPATLDDASTDRLGDESRHVEGNLQSELFDLATIAGHIDLANAHWRMRTQIHGLKVSRELLAFSPDPLLVPADLPEEFLGQANLLCELESTSTDLSQCRVAASGSFEGRIHDARLPQPLSNVQIAFRCNNEVLQIKNATAQAGETQLSLNGHFCRDGTLSLHASADRLSLNQQLFESLPIQWRGLWSKFQPEGLVKAQLDLARDGKANWNHKLIMDGQGVSFSYDRFPYRLLDGRGRLQLVNNVMDLINVHALASDRVVRIKGHMVNPGKLGVGWIEFHLADPIPLDDRFIAAIPSKSREFIEKLNAHGWITAWGRFERQAGAAPVENKQLRLGLSNCSMNYDGFPYPLYRIRGTVNMTNDHWRFDDLEAYNDSGWVMCHGTWAPLEQGGMLLSLDLNATDVPLEDELRDALKPEMRHFWNSISPRGTIDHLKIGLTYASAMKDLSVEVTASKRVPEQNVEGRSITVKPSWFPYRWDNVIGSVQFQDGVAQLTNIQAEHGKTKAAFSGKMEVTPDGSWRVHLEPLTVDHVDPTHELTSALPNHLGNAVENLNISGLVSLNGRLDLVGAGDPTPPPKAAWQVDLDLEDGELNCGVPLQHIHGGIGLNGESDGPRTWNRGQLAVDSMIFKGMQLTRVQGPIYLENGKLLIGESIPQAPSSAPNRPVTANLWEGTLALNGTVSLDDQMHFDLATSLVDGDLATISREASPSQHNITGRVFANAILSGNGRAAHTLRGRGNVMLRDADLYRLPVIISLLKPLTLKPPDQTAFDSSEVDFRIEADRVYFDRIDFDGDVISLNGRGEMDFQRQINLTFGTAIGRDDLYNSLLRPVMKEAGRRLVLLHVTGNLDDPHVRRELVPELNQTIQQLFPNQAREQTPQRSASRPLDPRRLFQRILPR